MRPVLGADYGRYLALTAAGSRCWLRPVLDADYGRYLVLTATAGRCCCRRLQPDRGRRLQPDLLLVRPGLPLRSLGRRASLPGLDRARGYRVPGAVWRPPGLLSGQSHHPASQVSSTSPPVRSVPPSRLSDQPHQPTCQVSPTIPPVRSAPPAHLSGQSHHPACHITCQVRPTSPTVIQIHHLTCHVRPTS